MTDEGRKDTARTLAPDWVLELPGADAVLGVANPPAFRSAPWVARFAVPSDLTELADVADPLLYVWAGAESVRGIEAKMDELVALAREQGRSWTEIGRALGVTKQTAWARLSRVVAQGKTKTVENAGNGEVYIRSKDDITAGDGAQHDFIIGKAAASTRTTVNVFRLLERHGIRTHLVDDVDDVTFRARDVAMIPLELVARRYATGSYVERFPELTNGAMLDDIVVEMFEKDDARHDPLVEIDHEHGVVRRFTPNRKAATAVGQDATAGDLLEEEPLASSRYADISPELLTQLRDLTRATFAVVEQAWKQHGGVYLDVKIECGLDRQTGELLVADVIDSDSGRLRFGDVDMSKQSYRDGTATLPEIKRSSTRSPRSPINSHDVPRRAIVTTLHVSDLDFTLLLSDARLGAATTDVLNKVIGAGHLFTCATARSGQSATRVLAGVDLNLPLITYGGAVLVDPGTRAITSVEQLPSGVVEAIALATRDHPRVEPILFAMVDGRDRVCWREHHTTAQLETFLRRRTGDPRLLPLHGWEALVGAEVFYATLIGDRHDVENLRSELSPALENCFHTLGPDGYHPHHTWFEMTSVRATKAAAARSLATHVGADTIIAFGDNLNDVPLFEVADHTCAVANAVPELLAIAHEVIGSNDDQGVAAWLQRSLLLTEPSWRETNGMRAFRRRREGGDGFRRRSCSSRR